MKAYRKLQQFALLVGAGALLPAVAHAEDTWPCEVVLCMANPSGPTALKECEAPIRKAWKSWSRGKSIPSCKRKDASGADAGDLSVNEGALQEQAAEPIKNCPMTYVATRKKTAYCAFSGVTEQWIDGQLWGRIWYGGPTEEPYIEYLVESPNNPRPPQAIVSAWPGMKADIEAKAETADKAYKVWEVAENESLLATAQAMLAAQQATQYAQDLAALEASLPDQIAAATDQYDYYTKELAGVQVQLAAAEVTAKKPGASDADLAAYEDLKVIVNSYEQMRLNAANQVATLQAKQAQLPQMHTRAAELAAAAADAQAIADEKQGIAQARKAESDAAELAAQPLPKFYSSGGDGA